MGCTMITYVVKSISKFRACVTVAILWRSEDEVEALTASLLLWLLIFRYRLVHYSQHIILE